jgi:AcrR family transcriptional regulator
MKSVKPELSHHHDEKIPPRERLLAAAAEMFYRRGIRAAGVEAIAEAAGTNKMTLYRHFPSKDELVAEYLRQAAGDAERRWRAYELSRPGDPLAQIRAWLAEMADHLANPNERGCALANAAVELPDKAHPARRVIEDHKIAQRNHLIDLCQQAGLSQPEMLADELHLLLEGARVTAQSVGADGLSVRLTRMGAAMIAANMPRCAAHFGHCSSETSATGPPSAGEARADWTARGAGIGPQSR